MLITRATNTLTAVDRLEEMTVRREHSTSADNEKPRGSAGERIEQTGSEDSGVPAQQETQRLIYELQRHEAELRKQNEELRQAWEQVQQGLKEQIDLYDFAPVAYFTLDRNGLIRRVNLAGAQLLGATRSSLEQAKFGQYVSPETRPAFNAFLNDVLVNRSRGTCELVMLTGAREALHVLIEAGASHDGEECRVAVVNVSKNRRAEQQRQSLYRETLRGVTRGKLDLISYEELSDYLNSSETTLRIASAADTTRARHEIMDYCASKGLEADALGSFEGAVGEAMTNALKHADEAQVDAGFRDDSVWVAVSDRGPAISSLDMPGATPGEDFSSTALLGMGYAIMMEASDRIMFCTGAQGRAVVVSRNTAAPKPAVPMDDLLENWEDTNTPD